MPTTTNYGWTTPADTDLVKDGAAAIRTLGNGIDTTTKNLNPETTLGDISYQSSTANTKTRLPIGTTGQVLTVVGGVPAWSSETGDITEVQGGTGISVASGTGPIPIVTNTVATTFDAKADLIAGTGADTFARLAVGADNTVLTADSSTATGLKWTTGSSITELASGSLSGSNITLSSINQTYKDLILTFNNAFVSTDDGRAVTVRVNADSTANRHISVNPGASTNQSFNDTVWYVYPQADNAVGGGYSTLQIYDYTNTTAYKMGVSCSFAPNATTTTNINYQMQQHIYNQTTAITSLYLATGTGTWSSGTYKLYGVK